MITSPSYILEVNYSQLLNTFAIRAQISNSLIDFILLSATSNFKPKTRNRYGPSFIR